MSVHACAQRRLGPKRWVGGNPFYPPLGGPGPSPSVLVPPCPPKNEGGAGQESSLGGGAARGPRPVPPSEVRIFPTSLVVSGCRGVGGRPGGPPGVQCLPRPRLAASAVGAVLPPRRLAGGVCPDLGCMVVSGCRAGQGVWPWRVRRNRVAQPARLAHGWSACVGLALVFCAEQRPGRLRALRAAGGVLAFGGPLVVVQ